MLVCEGYATGASLHMATSLPVAIAFDAGNLLPVSKAMRERFAGCPLIICRDDDWKTKRPNGDAWNPGEEKAANAALVVGGQVVAPVFSGEREIKWTDFNDLHVAEGLEAVRRQVLAVVKPPAAGGWKDQLARTENGSLIAHMQNVERSWATTNAGPASSATACSAPRSSSCGLPPSVTAMAGADVAIGLYERWVAKRLGVCEMPPRPGEPGQ